MKSPSNLTLHRGLLATVSALAISFASAPPVSATSLLVGRDWAQRNPLPKGDNILAVASGSPTTNAPVGGRRLVAVGAHGLILSSDDGTTWTARSATRLKGSPASATKVATPILDNLNDVVFADGKYIAVGALATWQELNATTGKVDNISKVTIVTSLDGLTWTDASADGSVSLYSVTGFPNQIVAVGGAGKTGATLFSDHGTVWRTATTGVSAGPMMQVSAAGSNLYAVAPTLTGGVLKGTFAASTWTWAKVAGTLVGGAPLAATDVPQSLVYNGARFVMLTQSATAGRKLWASTSGSTWAACVMGTTTPALNATHLQMAGTEVLAVGLAGEFWKSADGANFTTLNRIPTTKPQNLRGGAVIGSTYVVVGDGGRIFSILPPGETAWTSRYSTGTTADILGMATNGTGFVGVGNGFSVTSPTGAVWTENTPLTTGRMASVTHTGSQYVAAGDGAWTSPDGVTWTEVLPAATAKTLNRVVWTGTQVVAVGFDATAALSVIQTSDTGALGTWNKRTLSTGSNKALRGVAYSGGLFVAVGDGGAVQTSPDFGLTWTKRAATLATGENFTDVVFGSNLFIAVTNKGTIWTSANGVAWVKRKASSAAGYNRVVAAGTQVIAFGAGGLEAFSYGGIYWSEMNAATAQDLMDAAYAPGNLVATGLGGAILQSQGAQPTRTALSFSTGALPVSEGVVGGTTTLTLNLSPASLLPVTVAFSLSGTAAQGTAASSDYSVPLTPVTFAAGQTSKTLTVTIKSDAVDEVDETAVFTLGAPTGDAVLGATNKLTLTIQDDDQIPTFTAQPASVLTKVGNAVSLSAKVAASGTLTAPATLTGTWKKGTASAVLSTQTATAVASPAGATFAASIASAKLTDAGAYTVLAKNPAGQTTSATAQVGVVLDNVPERIDEKVADSTVILTVSAAGTGLSYQWTKGGVDLPESTDGRITGVMTAKLTIKSIDVGDIGHYACRVTMTTPTVTLTQTGGSAYLNVLTTVPVVTTASLGTTTVGQVFSFTPVATGNPSRWVATGLPSGLSINALTGVISGKITQAITAGVDWPGITLKASNALGDSPVKTVTLHINPLPANAVNSWVGLLNRTAGNANLGGRFSLAIANTGIYSGSLTIGTYTANLSGGVTFDPNGPLPVPPPATGPVVTLSEAITPSLPELAPCILNVTIDPTAQTITATVTTGADVADIVGWRTNQWTGAALAHTTGKYNFVIQPAGVTIMPTPKGYGFGSFDVDASGNYTAAGKLADGQAFSCSGVLGTTDTAGVTDVQIYQGLYAGAAGSLHGSLTLTEVVNGATYNDNKVRNRLTWYKPDQADLIPESHPHRRLYGAGFGTDAVQVQIDGGRYFDPKDLKPPVTTTQEYFGGLKPGVSNAKLQFFSDPTQGAGIALNPSLTATDPTVVFDMGSPPTNSITFSGLNPAAVTFQVDGATGTFSGTMTLTDFSPVTGSDFTRAPGATEASLVSRFYGMVIRRNGQSTGTPPTLDCRGFLMLEQFPQAGLSGATTLGASGTTPMVSAGVHLVRNN